MKLFVILLALCGLLAGCSSVHSERNPHVDLSKLRRFYVEHRLSDNHRVDEAIVAELQARGFEASAGPLTMMPDGIDALVTYQDEWAWDFKSYLIQLDVVIRSPHRNLVFAGGSYRQPSPRAQPLPTVVHRLFDSLLQTGGK